MSIADSRIATNVAQILPNWTHFEHETAFRCHVILWPEEDGGFSAHCTNLAGVVSQGDSMQEALNNIAECFRATIEYYRESGERIPWGDVSVERPTGFLERSIEVRM
jgi:predicted RNase H-like HicB family nuclease